MPKHELETVRCMLAIENWRAWRNNLAYYGLVCWLEKE